MTPTSTSNLYMTRTNCFRPATTTCAIESKKDPEFSPRSEPSCRKRSTQPVRDRAPITRFCF